MRIGSLDVVGLYLAIDLEEVGRIGRDKTISSNITISGLDYTWALVYLSVTMSPAEKVDAKVVGLLPRRQVARGRKPTVHTANPEDSKWYFPTPPNSLNQ